MRSDKEIAQEALRLAVIIRRHRASNLRRIRAACLMVACLVLVVGLSFALPVMDTNAKVPEGIYSATLFAGGTAGGYVLMGVVGFVFGMAVTLFCFRKAKRD